MGAAPIAASAPGLLATVTSTSRPATPASGISISKTSKAQCQRGSRQDKDIPWTTNKLNYELNRLGQTKPKVKWANSEMENMWLRREVTSQLLQNLVTMEKRPESRETDGGSTRAPDSATSSSRG